MVALVERIAVADGGVTMDDAPNNAFFALRLS